MGLPVPLALTNRRHIRRSVVSRGNEYGDIQTLGVFERGP